MTRDNNTIYRLNTLFAPLLILLLLLWSVETVDAAYEQRQDKYLLLDQLGTGTFGTVHRVQDRSTREILAMKISQDHQRAVDEAKHESEILRALGGHTGVIELRDEFPCFVGKYCLVLELMSCDLMVIMTEIKQLKWEERLIAVRKLARDILPALIRMSEIGLIHADIKPENILYNRERKLYKLADFGLSIKRGQNITGIRGTPQYISPEIYAYSQFSSASDIWAFGETLLNMFLYKIVFEPENGGGGIILDIRNGLAARWQRWLGPVPSQLAEDLRHKTRFTVTSISNSWKGELRQQLQADDAPELAVFADFIERCLRYNPEERITAREAISHPFVSHRKIRQRKPANVVKSSAI